MLAAQIGEKFGGGSGTPGSDILVASTDALDGFCEVLALPLKVGGQSIVEGRSRVLAAPFGVLFQLRLTLRFKWDHIHVGLSFLPFIVRGSAAEVKSYLLALPQGKQIIPLSMTALECRVRREAVHDWRRNERNPTTGDCAAVAERLNLI